MRCWRIGANYFFSLRTGFLPVWLLICLLAVPEAGWTFQDRPFFTRHLSPISNLFGLPGAEGGRLTAAEALDARLVLNVANSFVHGSTERDAQYLAGETTRYELVLRYGLPWGGEGGIDLPLVHHHDGYFDDFIDEFHDFFKISSNGRNGRQDGGIQYIFTRDGKTRFSVDGETAGMGDVALFYALPLVDADSDQRALALRMGIKLPTGDSDRLLGSGSTDFSLRLTGTDRQALENLRLTLFGGVGVLLMTDGDILPELQRNIVGAGFLGTSWNPLSWLSCKLQIDIHSPLFSGSEIRELSSWSQQIVAGFTFALPQDVFCDFAITENFIEETSPDVVLHLALRRTF
ncbi:MAG: DUF3187 family protein [Desulfuromonadales bacterium]